MAGAEPQHIKVDPIGFRKKNTKVNVPAYEETGIGMRKSFIQQDKFSPQTRHLYKQEAGHHLHFTIQ